MTPTTSMPMLGKNSSYSEERQFGCQCCTKIGRLQCSVQNLFIWGRLEGRGYL